MKDKLVNSHMIDLFANSGWKDGLVTGNSLYLKKINELHNRLSQLQIVEQFHYISNPNSLIHWALTYVFILLSSFLRLSSSTFWAYSSFFYSKVCTACSYSVGSESWAITSFGSDFNSFSVSFATCAAFLTPRHLRYNVCTHYVRQKGCSWLRCVHTPCIPSCRTCIVQGRLCSISQNVS